MSRGFLTFAHNPDLDSYSIDYGLMAVWQARRIKRYLGLGTTLVTDRKTILDIKTHGISPLGEFEKVILSTEESWNDQYRPLAGNWIPFKNLDRVTAYELTPYDQTMVIDTDILICSTRLNRVWDLDEPLLISRQARDCIGRPFPDFDHLKDHGIEFIWATEFYFTKCAEAEQFFAWAKECKRQYEWKSRIYGVGASPLRNDHVWSMAAHELGGCYSNHWIESVPGSLIYCIDKDKILDMREQGVSILAQDGDTHRMVKITDKDVHLMNKTDLIMYIKRELGV